MKPNGFTLLEVLVAGFILFISLSAATLIFTSSTKSSANATSAVKIYGYASLIRNDIKISLTGSERSSSGTGRFMGIDYLWSAKPESSKNTIPTFSEESGFDDSTREIILWNVELVLTQDRKEHDFQFLVTSW